MNRLADIWHKMASLGAARVRSMLADVALMAAIGLCLLAAAVFGLQALHGVLRVMVGPVAASALFAGMMLIAALILALWVSERRNKAVLAVSLVMPQADPVTAPVAFSAPTTDSASDPAPDLGISAAFLAGFLLARRLL